MTPEPDALGTKIDEQRHRVAAPLTLIQARTQLLQRQLARMSDMPEADRAHCAAALAEILQACRALTQEIALLVDAKDPPR